MTAGTLQRSPMRPCGRAFATEEEALLTKLGQRDDTVVVPCRRCEAFHLRRVRAQSAPTRAPARDTGSDDATRLAVLRRDGYACVCCGESIVGRQYSLQHRGARGAIMTPAQGNRLPPASLFCVDNGCGPGRDGKPGAGYPGDSAYVAFLQALGQGDGYDDCDPDTSWCLFAVAPDVVGDAAATLRRSRHMLGWIRYAGFPAALAAQDGLEDLAVPWDDFDALFLGGTTGWKLGRAARALAAEARHRGKHVHMGRVNSLRRLLYAAAVGCDSADGTFIARGPSRNLPIALGWQRAANGQGALFDVIGTVA